MGGGEKEIPPSFGKYEANFLPAVRLSQQLRLGAPKVSWSVSVWVLWFLQLRQTLYEGVDKGIQLLNSFVHPQCLHGQPAKEEKTYKTCSSKRSG